MFKKLFAQIPQNRLLVYLLALGLLPVGIVAFDYLIKARALDALSLEVTRLQSEALTKRQSQAGNNLVREHYAACDHFYLERALENLPLLKKEREALEKMVGTSLFSGSDAQESRLAFLKGSENRLRFTEGNIQVGEGIRETIVTLDHPVEIDTDDLREILERVEEKKEGAPQLLIADFTIAKKRGASASEVYELSLKLVKREFGA